MAGRTPRSRVLLLLGAAGLIAGLGAQGLDAAGPALRAALDLPNDELEIAYGAAGFGFFAALPLGGVLIELFGVAPVLVSLGAALAAAICLTGLAWSLTALSLARLVLGLAAGLLLPAAVAGLAPWTPPRERGAAMGTVHALLAAGGVLAWPCFALARPLGAWRAVFLLLAIAAALWVAACRRWFQAEPGDAYDRGPVLPINWRRSASILVLPTALAFIQGWGVVLCLDWAPHYLLAARHFDMKLSFWVWAASAIALVLGCAAGGIAADRALYQSGNIRSAHQVVPAAGFLLGVLGLAYLPGATTELGIALPLAVALFGLQAAGVMLWVFAIDIGGKHPGAAAGFIGLAWMSARAASPMLLDGIGPLLPWYPVTALLVVAGILSFRLKPHIELALRYPPEPEPEEREEGDEIEALGLRSGR